MVAIVVLLIGLDLIDDKGPTFDAPTKTTIAVEASQGAGTGKSTEAKERTEPAKPGEPVDKTTTTTETPTGSPSGKTTTTVEASPRSFPERVLGESGLDLLQIAVVLLAAFLAAAFTQRIMLGEFALKLGVLDVPAVPVEAVEVTTEGLGAELAVLTEKLEKVEGFDKTAKDLAATQEEQANESVKIGLVIAHLSDRIERLEEKVDRA